MHETVPSKTVKGCLYFERMVFFFVRPPLSVVNKSEYQKKNDFQQKSAKPPNWHVRHVLANKHVQLFQFLPFASKTENAPQSTEYRHTHTHTQTHTDTFANIKPKQNKKKTFCYHCLCTFLVFYRANIKPMKGGRYEIQTSPPPLPSSNTSSMEWCLISTSHMTEC